VTSSETGSVSRHVSVTVSRSTYRSRGSGPPGVFELSRVENGSCLESCPPRLVVGCVGLRSRVCIVQHIYIYIYQPPTATSPTRHSIESPYAALAEH
jgi:hypothetical protein